MYYKIVKAVLVTGILCQFVCPININASPLLNGLLLVVLSSIFISFKFDYVLSLLLCTVGILLIYRTNPTKQTNHTKQTKVQPGTETYVTAPEPTEPTVDQITNECAIRPDYLEIHYGKTQLHKDQTNIFDSINSKLFYKTLGEQHNIQGIEDTISGYDSTMFI